MRFDYLENPSLFQQAITTHYAISEEEAVKAGTQAFYISLLEELERKYL